MSQQLTASLRDYFTRTPNPRASQLGSMDRAYANNVADTAEQLFRNAVNLPEPVVYLVADTNMDAPMPISCIFSIDTPGGPQNTGNYYAFVGDIPSPGSMPPVIQVNHQIFERLAPYRVNTHATLAAAWTATQPGDTHLSRPDDDAHAEDIGVRNAVPVPHDQVPAILDAHANGTLTNRWLHNQILHPLQTNAVTAAAYPNFINWLRVAGTLGAADAAPPVDTAYAAVFGVPQVLARAPAVLAQHLPGLRTPSTVQASLNQITLYQQQMTQQQQSIAQQMQQAATSAAQPRIKTLQEKDPNLHEHVLRLCEQPAIDQCTSFWKRVHLVPKAGVLPLLLQELSKNGAHHNMVDASFATDLYNIQWIPSDPTELTQGLSITRLSSYYAPATQQASRDEANRTYQLLTSVDTSTPVLTEIILTKSAAIIPTTASMLRAQVTAFNQLLVTIAGPGTQHTKAFRTHVVDNMDAIEHCIRRHYATQEKEVCLVITLWIVRTMRQAFIELMDGAVPTAAVPQPVTQTPPYHKVLKCLQLGKIFTLQDVPSSLEQQRRPVAPAPTPAPAPAPTGRGSGAGTGAPPASGTGPSTSGGNRGPVRNPNQNPRLKQAWIRAGDPSRSIYQRPGDPFYDADAPTHKVVVMRLAGNRQQRICLPMACKGTCTNTCQGYHGELTPAEEEAVAAAATPPLAL